MRTFYTLGNGKYTLGVCAMENKVESSPMKSILNRITTTGEFTIIVFMQDMILNEDISNWPKVDCLISFYSAGFPLNKAISYTKLKNPIILNDLEKQILMRSRLEIFNILDKWKIPRPECIIINHSELSEDNHDIFYEEYDFIIYKGQKIQKPFIEKPIFSDNHDNWIYYPKNSGGGCKKLFRKVGDRSSEYDSNLWKVRKDGTYIYEKFLPTFGTDIKVYTVGPMFAHAEARKSPCLDGKVQRTEKGKEVRYSVMLSYDEKLIAHQIVKAFNQTICGFDILRTVTGESVVCDVNGFSFVKGNEKYYNDCAQIITSLFLKKLFKKNKIIPMTKFEKKKKNMSFFKKSREVNFEIQDNSKFNSNIRQEQQKDELSTVIVIMRHGVRKPKLKLKFETQDHRIISLLSNGKEETRLKSPEELSLLLAKNTLILENLFMSLEDHSKIMPDNQIHKICKVLNNHLKLQAFLGDGKGFSGVNRKVQLKQISHIEDGLNDKKTILLVAKWGGELTKIGCEQAEELGKHLRATLYPGDSEGLLRLHSTFRHDLKIYSSDEGRCQVTSAAFTKGFLDLEGDLAPILVQLVIRDSFARSLLDDPHLTTERKKCKKIIENLLNIDKVVGYEEIFEVWRNYKTDLKEEFPSEQVIRTLMSCGNPYSTLKRLHVLMKELVMKIYIDQDEENNIVIYQGFRQSLDSLFKVHGSEKNDGFPVSQEIMQRWNQLTSSFFNEETQRFVTAKIPDIMDNAVYDISYNVNFIKNEVSVLLYEIYETVVPVGEFVSLFQYGLSGNQKVSIGKTITHNLIEKLLQDIKYSHVKKLRHEKNERDGDENKRKTRGFIFKNARKMFNNINSAVSNDCSINFLKVHPEEHIRLKEEEAKAFGIKSPWRIVRSRFYVTSASHIQSLANIFSSMYKNQISKDDKASLLDLESTFSELNYLSHIVIRVWESRSISESDQNRFKLEMFISKGVKNKTGQILNAGIETDHETNIQRISELFPLKKVTSKHFNITEFENKIRELIKDYH
ncbi:histidine acid phosphatase [Cryptosporidium sp. chipmunk genotype I]|uniref:histidine acid phosphatase n=1 Tax=Cryptosporidium sp. chipmunk genotype I TaxID=1280935 RepID=UPI00351A4112|nr:histidine acid phosphatase [Cryptosporidium sp. chipmunk genotype I]